MKQLLEAGVHFGHQTRRWNPKMAPYIYTERNGIYIIDLQKSVGKVDEAYKAISDIAADGGTILFVGTKKQAQDAIQTEAERCGMFYVNERWLGGMLTNFKTIQGRIARLKAIETMQEDGTFDVLPKNIWKEEKERAISLEKVDTDFVGYGSDIDAEAIKIAIENASRLPIGKKLHFEKRDIKDFKKYSERGTVICNPPYGERMLEIREAEQLYKVMGEVLRPDRDNPCYIISPHEEFEKFFGRPADRRRKLYNGMIPCNLYEFFKPREQKPYKKK